MSESQINTLVFVVLVRKYIATLTDESQVITLRNKAILFIMERFNCGYSRACQIFSSTYSVM